VEAIGDPTFTYVFVGSMSPFRPQPGRAKYRQRNAV
jgi:hypothetical protein